MSADLHPDDLIERRRNGTLDAEGGAALDAHLRTCNACRLELALRRDFDEERASKGDLELAATLATAALASSAMKEAIGALGAAPGTAASGAHSASSLGSQPLTFSSFLAMGTGVGVGIALIALASVEVVEWMAPAREEVPRRGAPSIAATPPPEPIAPPNQSPPSFPSPAPPPPAEAVVPAPAPSPPSRPPTPARRDAPPSPSANIEAPPPAPATHEAVTVTPPATARELFARASAARRRRDVSAASAAFEALIESYPNSREASTALVLLGNLLLERGGDRARAAALFDLYLSREPSGNLAEEARLGRARARGGR